MFVATVGLLPGLPGLPLSTPYREQNTLLLGVGAVRQYGVPSFNPLWGTALIVVLTDMGNGFTGMLLTPYGE